MIVLFYTQAKSQFKRRSTANNVEIHIPVPPDADSPKFKVIFFIIEHIPCLFICFLYKYFVVEVVVGTLIT